MPYFAEVLDNDNYIDSSNTLTNYGTVTGAFQRYDLSGKTTIIDRIIISHDISSLIPALIAGSQIISAALAFYASSGVNPASFQLQWQRVIRDIHTGGETDNTYAYYDLSATLAWGTAGCNDTSTDRDTTVASDQRAFSVSLAFCEWSAKDIASDAINNRSGIFQAIAIEKAWAAASNNQVTVYTSEGGAPYLRIWYTILSGGQQMYEQIAMGGA